MFAAQPFVWARAVLFSPPPRPWLSYCWSPFLPWTHQYLPPPSPPQPYGSSSASPPRPPSWAPHPELHWFPGAPGIGEWLCMPLPVCTHRCSHYIRVLSLQNACVELGCFHLSTKAKNGESFSIPQSKNLCKVFDSSRFIQFCRRQNLKPLDLGA